MILTGHQSTYLPWLGLFNKISNADQYVYFDDVQYLPKEWMNRNRIKGVNNNVIFLTVPVRKKHFLIKKTTDLLIDNSLPWRRKHLKSLEINYRKSIFFEKYIDEFVEIYKQEWDYLVDLNLYTLKILLKLLGMQIKIVKLSELGVEGKKSNLVLNVCKKLNANQFVFGEKGSDYAVIEDFNKNNIKPVFQNYIHPTYKQIGNKFISHLSVIDLLFNCGDKSLDIINQNQHCS
jgi:hypothetical protein